MTEKTKAKIEAMADRWSTGYDVDGIERQNYERRDALIDGASAWAEWCERFEKEMQTILDATPNDKNRTIRGIAHFILLDYRKWLEDIDE